MAKGICRVLARGLSAKQSNNIQLCGLIGVSILKFRGINVETPASRKNNLQETLYSPIGLKHDSLNSLDNGESIIDSLKRHTVSLGKVYSAPVDITQIDFSALHWLNRRVIVRFQPAANQCSQRYLPPHQTVAQSQYPHEVL